MSYADILSRKGKTVHSTYVRTTIRIRNTYIHTYSLEFVPCVFGRIANREINAYSFGLNRGGKHE